MDLINSEQWEILSLTKFCVSLTKFFLSFLSTLLGINEESGSCFLLVFFIVWSGWFDSSTDPLQTSYKHIHFSCSIDWIDPSINQASLSQSRFINLTSTFADYFLCIFANFRSRWVQIATSVLMICKICYLFTPLMVQTPFLLERSSLVRQIKEPGGEQWRSICQLRTS